jgi:hypothetical protein
VADDRQEVVPIGELLVGASALGQQVSVGPLSLQRQEICKCVALVLAFALQTSVGRRPLALQDLVRLGSVVPDDGLFRSTTLSAVVSATCLARSG